MKKILALMLCMLLVMLGLTACKAKLKNGELLTDNAGQNYAAVTNENGGVQRDEAGNLVVLVTDENGKNVKSDGEYATRIVGLEHALVVGDRIEMPDYALTIPKGWSNEKSFNDLVIKRESNGDTISINAKRNESLSGIMEAATTPIDQIKATYESAVYTNKGVAIQDMDAQLISVFVPETNTFWGYVFFERSSVAYSCMLTGNHDLSGSMDDILAILNTIEFIQ